MKFHLFTAISIATISCYNLTLHTADNEHLKHKKLITLVTKWGKPCTYISEHYASVVNHQNENGKTALMHSAWLGRPENITALIAIGADPFMKDKKGRDILSLTLREAYTFPLQVRNRQCINTFALVKSIFNISDDKKVFEWAVQQGITFSQKHKIILRNNISILKQRGTKEAIWLYWTIYCLMLQYFPDNSFPKKIEDIKAIQVNHY